MTNHHLSILDSLITIWPQHPCRRWEHFLRFSNRWVLPHYGNFIRLKGYCGTQFYFVPDKRKLRTMFTRVDFMHSFIKRTNEVAVLQNGWKMTLRPHISEEIKNKCWNTTEHHVPFYVKLKDLCGYLTIHFFCVNWNSAFGVISVRTERNPSVRSVRFTTRFTVYTVV